MHVRNVVLLVWKNEFTAAAAAVLCSEFRSPGTHIELYAMYGIK